MTKSEKKIDFEENISELERIVTELESGNVNLDDALTKFNKAYQLSKECDQKLKEVSESVNKIFTEEGKLEEFHIEEE